MHSESFAFEFKLETLQVIQIQTLFDLLQLSSIVLKCPIKIVQGLLISRKAPEVFPEDFNKILNKFESQIIAN
jgi:hypothetical protein